MSTRLDGCQKVEGREVGWELGLMATMQSGSSEHGEMLFDSTEHSEMFATPQLLLDSINEVCALKCFKGISTICLK